jgi:hypothetical protein
MHEIMLFSGKKDRFETHGNLPVEFVAQF